MNFWRFFIKDYDTLPIERVQKGKLIVGCLLIFFVLEFAATILKFFDLHLTESNIFALVFVFGLLTYYKYTNDESIIFIFLLLVASGMLIYEIYVSGKIFSINIKWYLAFMVLVSFMKPNWIIPYSIFIVSVLVCMYYTSESNVGNGSFNVVRSVELIDHLFFVVILCGLLVILNYFRDKSKETIVRTNSLLKERTIELNTTNHELQRFAYVMSHDLKTELRTITSFSSLLEKEIADLPDSAKAQAYLNYVKNGSLRLNQLIKDIQSFSKFSEMPFEEHPQDINSIVSTVETSMDEYIQSKNARINVKTPLPTIQGSSFHLYTLFQNLIVNGLKFNKSKEPEVAISYQVENDRHQIEIKDNGIGIPKEYHRSVFDMFSRLHTRDNYSGSGLGLALCKNIMQKMGGDIFIKNRETMGTSIYLQFPIK